MIHELVVTPEMTERELSKLSRRYAMTGGFEIRLPDGLTAGQITDLFARFLPKALEREPGTSRFRSSNAFRILELLTEEGACPDNVRQEIMDQVLSVSGEASPG